MMHIQDFINFLRLLLDGVTKINTPASDLASLVDLLSNISQEAYNNRNNRSCHCTIVSFEQESLKHFLLADGTLHRAITLSSQ